MRARRKKREKMPRPEAISEILAGVLKGRGFDKKIKQYSVFNIWEDLVGPTISKQTEPQKVQGETLVVLAKNASWVQELSFMKGMMLKKIQEKIPNSGIVDIKFISSKRR